MLRKIVFDNYKAFEHGEIEIKPITILLGANSAGKSSIMQLFLMLQQTAESEEDYGAALKLNGSYVGMGEPLNLLRGKKNDNLLSLRISICDEMLKSEVENAI